MAAAKYVSRFTTAGHLAVIEQWLKSHARGVWSFKLESVSDDLVQKTYSLTFDQASDRLQFRTRFSPSAPKAH
jgi:hypothetical protein